jgi:hypothetical protein
MAVALPIAAQANEEAIGKYYRLVSHMLGIQKDKDGRITSGNIVPNDDKFFIDIHLAAHQSCTIASDNLAYWWLCSAQYEIQIDNSLFNKEPLRGDTTENFIGPFSNEFILTDGEFASFLYASPNYYYLSDGKCAKL